MLTAKDHQQLQSKGITQDIVEQQITNFEQGFPFMKLVRAATVGDGIVSLSDHEVDQAIEHYQSHLADTKVVKFVPASGAASRMFKELFGLMDSPEQSDRFPKAVAALEQIRDFAFYQELSDKLSSVGHDLVALILSGDYNTPFEFLLRE